MTTEKKPLKNVFLSSIHQDAGKTTVSLGLYALFLEHKLKTAFMKPVGQKSINIDDYDIDKDSYLMREVFHCSRSSKKLKDMSPVIVAKGFTEKYIFEPQRDKLTNAIQKSFKSLISRKDAIIVEGTGHSGVGSIIDLSNADVAKLLGSKVIIISGGGIGRSFDEIMLNKALFDLNQVEILGVIINKVIQDKYDRIKKAIEQSLSRRGVRLLGVIPEQPLLSVPTIQYMQQMLKLELLCGDTGMNRRVKHVIVAAMEPHNMIHYIQDGTLVLASGDRIDNILLAVSSHLVQDGRSFQISGIILTGGLMPDDKIKDLLAKSQIPVLFTQDDTYTVASKIEHIICKIEATDSDKIQEATRLVKKYVDVQTIINNA